MTKLAHTTRTHKGTRLSPICLPYMLWLHGHLVKIPLYHYHRDTNGKGIRLSLLDAVIMVGRQVDR